MQKQTLHSLLFSSLLIFSCWANAESDSAATEDELPLEDLRTFTEAFHQIRTNYVNEVSDQELLEYAINGMLSGLDPHSSYLNKTDYLLLQESTSGEFGGLGLEVTMENGFIKVVSPIDDTPAYRAGIQAGDLILKIDNKAVKGLKLDDSIDLMRGKKGSKVSLTIIREGMDKPLDITLKRDVIIIKSVKSRLLEKKYGYLRIAQFQNKTAKDVKTHIEKMLDDTNNQLQGLIIDLRNNPGGILNAAIDISDTFLTEGIIVYTEGRTNESKEEFHATNNALLKDKPIVILINSGSASASEIVAGALQDHNRAVIAGTTSFGKGSVQVILPLPRERAIKLTTARYYTPLGRSIQAEGIKPDIKIQSAKLTFIKDTLEIKEANLSKHLKNKNKEKTAKNKESDPLINDYQLHEALNLLKAMVFTQKTNKP